MTKRFLCHHVTLLQPENQKKAVDQSKNLITKVAVLQVHLQAQPKEGCCDPEVWGSVIWINALRTLNPSLPKSFALEEVCPFPCLPLSQANKPSVLGDDCGTVPVLCIPLHSPAQQHLPAGKVLDLQTWETCWRDQGSKIRSRAKERWTQERTAITGDQVRVP